MAPAAAEHDDQHRMEVMRKFKRRRRGLSRERSQRSKQLVSYKATVTGPLAHRAVDQSSVTLQLWDSEGSKRIKENRSKERQSKGKKPA